MLTAKDIIIKLVSAQDAKRMVSLFHYSGKACNNSQIHFGVFIKDTIQGVLSFGPSIDKRRMAQNLGIGMNEFLELNRMALSDLCPKNSESRALSICLNMLKKQYPFLKLIVSFADACQCGDGTIYRASGFKLHSFKKNNSLLIDSEGNVDFNHGTKKRPTSKISLTKYPDKSTDGRIQVPKTFKPIPGYQMKYIYFFDKELEKKFNFVAFKDIPDNVRMYKGQGMAQSAPET